MTEMTDLNNYETYPPRNRERQRTPPFGIPRRLVPHRSGPDGVRR